MSMDFRSRLQKAIQRGRRTAEDRRRQEELEALNEEELRRLHSQYRLALTERIEQRLRELVREFPGFEFTAVMSDRGWGAAVSRDDFSVRDGKRENLFSRLEIVVRPFSSYHVLEVAVKATIRNKETLNTSYYQRLAEVDLESFLQTIDHWVLHFAESYSAQA